jgi:hypothetical protein
VKVKLIASFCDHCDEISHSCSFAERFKSCLMALGLKKTYLISEFSS